MKTKHWSFAKSVFVLLVLCRLCVVRARTEGPERKAEHMLNAAGVKGGLIVHIGSGDGKLTAALRVNDSYVVHGLDQSAENVARARKHIRSLGLYGPVSVGHWDGKSLPYTDNLVNVLICDRPLSIPMSEVMRVLCPHGIAYIKQDAKWVKKVKPLPDDIGEWTHYLHGPNNNAVAMDDRVGPPRHLQWKSDPMWCRSHNGVPSSVALVLSAGGRLFSIIDEGLIGQPGLPERWTLVARDAFNGTLLWKKPLARRISQKSMVAVGNKLYLASGRRGPLAALDAATGEMLRTFKGTEGSDEIVCTGAAVVAHRGGTSRSQDSKGGSVIALDADSGGSLWETPSKQMVRNSLAVADGRVCYHNGEEIVCLGLRSGNVLWRAACKTSQRGGC